MIKQDEYLPKWHKELEIFHKTNSLIVMEGNVLDQHVYPDDGTLYRLTDYLCRYFKDTGYESVVCYNSVIGFHNYQYPDMLSAFAKEHSLPITDDADAAECRFVDKGPGTVEYIIRNALKQHKKQKKIPTALILDLASRYVPSPVNLSQAAADAYTGLLLASLEAADVSRGNKSYKNLAVILVNKSNDIPAWIYLDNPNVKILTLHTPNREERKNFIENQFPDFFAPEVYDEDIGYFEKNPDALTRIKEKFIGLTDGLGYIQMMALSSLCYNEKIRMADLCSAVDLYRYGIKDNRWKELNMEMLAGAEEKFLERVKGQDAALHTTMDIVKRAVTGVSGLQHSSDARPKGILFFAGPTGSGKTETAKTLAEIIFGNDKAFVRFDMSEYGSPSSDQKLMGAPPGYVGYEAGGQLTNAIKKNPFTIILFDEIEKADRSIFDKFLQILEDGRMTDGQGQTVYFSESIIIFTSNIGMYTEDSTGRRHQNITVDTDYSEVKKRILAAVHDFFKIRLGRPEILNRIGENIVVFDFIREDDAKNIHTARDILYAQLDKICAAVYTEKKLVLTIRQPVKDALLQLVKGNLENGGRGIGNIVEAYFINPLGRYLFENGNPNDKKVDVKSLDIGVNLCSLNCDIL